MKSNNQYNKKPKYLKPATINLWSACLMCCFFILLLLSPLSFAGGEKPGFCWDMGNTSNCTLEFLYGTESEEKKMIERNESDDGDLVMVSDRFRFRSDCEGCSGLKGQDWEFQFASFEYRVDGKPTSPPFDVKDEKLVKIELNLNDGQSYPLQIWDVERKENGEGEELFSSYSGEIYLQFTLEEKHVRNLVAGKNYEFVFNLKGTNVYNGEIHRIQPYVFSLEYKEFKQVLISRLQNMNLRTFPDHMPYYTQNICIHASGDHKFSIRAEGTDKNQSNFVLSSSSNTISYIPLFGVGNDKPENSLMAMNGDTANEIFFGHDHKYCNGGTNMTLAVRLNTTFEELSQKPAGNYTDTLTLIVKAE
ncbi:hypothetical protein [Endozoicomonas euniceicola]|uniref:Uncharacterized protein n=1 Tax=Endozoicomonas euniceicola TaxID=1234143 RepID=A0ABY6GPK6_9GAMM|nr:hypothetical protein [Endozoicomonas euniceicola]UYM13924.1 hypothetical protein NX720_13455 [Endozoicomonas euniceicola]